MQLDLTEPLQAPPGQGRPWDWLLFFMRPYAIPLVLASLCSLAVQAAFRMDAFFFSMIIQTLETKQAASEPGRLWLWVGLFIGINALAIFALYFFVALRGSRIMDIISKRFALYGFNHLLALPESWHENHASGEKLQKLLSGRTGCFELLQSVFWHITPLLATGVTIVFSVLALQGPAYYLLLFLALVVTYLAFALATAKAMKKHYAAYYESLEQVVGGVYEFVVSTATMRLFNLRTHALAMGRDLETQNHAVRTALFKANFRRWFGLDALALFWISIIVVLAAYQTMQGTLSLAALTVIMFLCVSIWREMVAFALSINEIVERWESFKRLAELLNTPLTIRNNAIALPITPGPLHIRFDHVGFHYSAGKKVIRDFTLDIPAGRKIGLIGPSGAGKSTAVKLLMRFYDVETGAIRLNAQDIRDLQIENLQASIAVIPQDVVLFNHPLIENIRYGNLQASDEQVIEAARRAHAHEFIESLPQAYQTLVGERGVKLSGGQRQRIAIARAILKDAPILILDEATAALDSESEHFIQESLRDLMQGKTVIAIAHRLSTIAALDHLVVMDRGAIVEQGNHAELLAQNGLYAKLWAMQSGGFLCV
ncbi:MAG: ABC transporter ATP-binding protein/permease [Alphaproteobacteria bacterium]|nr:ABC transporter ATP-binding protein/permease [Alphaproteobacteria bacterium]